MVPKEKLVGKEEAAEPKENEGAVEEEEEAENAEDYRETRRRR